MEHAQQQDKFEVWAILELMGHVRLAGKVSEEERFGQKMGRIDIPTKEGFATQYFGGSSVYRLTPTTEEIARAVAAANQPRPVHAWEAPQLTSRSAGDDDQDSENGEDDESSEYDYQQEFDF